MPKAKKVTLENISERPVIATNYEYNDKGQRVKNEKLVIPEKKQFTFDTKGDWDKWKDNHVIAPRLGNELRKSVE